MENDLILLRYESSKNGTFGVLVHAGRWLCHTLEPADRSGAHNCAVSAGRYPFGWERSPRFGAVLPSFFVPGRSGLRFHAGNYARDTRGCVLVGESRGVSWLNNSRRALATLIDYLKQQCITHIRFIDYEDILF